MESISREIKKIPNKNLVNKSIVKLNEFEEEHLIINFYNKEVFHENTKFT